MNSRELRIGNLVTRDSHSHYSKVKEIHDSSVVLEEHSRTLWNITIIKPIPLTEEWLLRLGFKKRVTIGHSVQYFIGINPVTQDWLFDIVWQDSQEFPFYRNGHFKIQHIHQLQNLYFALTGEELKIKNDANN